VRVAGVLVQLEMTRRVERDRTTPTPIAVDSQGDLLRHRSAWQQGSSLLAHELGDAALERLDELALSVGVWPNVAGKRCRRRRQHDRRRSRAALL
jgi:hypothetical protein